MPPEPRGVGRPWVFLVLNLHVRYAVEMIADQLKDLLHATPFVPFKIFVAEQTEYDVPHPDFVLLSYGGRVMAVNSTKRDVIHIISVPLISRFETKSA